MSSTFVRLYEPEASLHNNFMAPWLGRSKFKVSSECPRKIFVEFKKFDSFLLTQQINQLVVDFRLALLNNGWDYRLNL